MRDYNPKVYGVLYFLPVLQGRQMPGGFPSLDVDNSHLVLTDLQYMALIKQHPEFGEGDFLHNTKGVLFELASGTVAGLKRRTHDVPMMWVGKTRYKTGERVPDEWVALANSTLPPVKPSGKPIPPKREKLMTESVLGFLSFGRYGPGEDGVNYGGGIVRS